MASIAATSRQPQAPHGGLLWALTRRALMYGDAHGWMTALLAIVMVVGDVVLVAIGKQVPSELSSGLLLVFGFFFGRAFQSPPPAPPQEPARPALVVPGHGSGPNAA
ncbi:MAG: hypothetical protein ACTHMP_09325 [Thermomicrobiales bacterium]